jgi:hypothetical protein
VQRGALRHGAAQHGGGYALSVAPDLHVGVVRRPVAAHDDRQAAHPFAPDKPDLDAAAGPVRDHGREAALDEVNMLDRLVAVLQLLSNGKVHGFQVRLQQADFVRRQAREKTIGTGGAALFRHGSFPEGQERTTLSAVRAPCSCGRWSYMLRI